MTLTLLNLVRIQIQELLNLLPKIKILHPHLEAEVVEMVEVEEVSDLGPVKSCAIGAKILFLNRKLVTR